MKRMTGEPWSLFVAVCLAFSQILIGCNSGADNSSQSDVFGASEGRLTRIQSKAMEDPKEEEEEMEVGGTGTAMALDEGKMGRHDSALRSMRSTGQYAMKNTGPDPALARAAVNQARNAGMLGSLPGGLDQARNAGIIGSLQGGIGSGTTLGYGAPAPGAMGKQMLDDQLLRSLEDDDFLKPDPVPESKTEKFKDHGRNPMVDTKVDNLSTFAVDVDTASYAITRRKIVEGERVPQSAVRVEEFVNYFRYNYPGPREKNMPFAVHMDAAPSPFSSERHVLRVGVQAKKLSIHERKAINLVFLVDVSGSMSSPDKLFLAQRALRILTHNLRDGDTVAMVTYAGRTSVVLEPTGLDEKGKILSAIEDLRAGGGTAMGSGMELAYELAARKLGPGAESRVIVLSDGDANIGRTSHRDMLATVAGHVKEGVTLSTVGFGMGNYKDTLMEQLANKGNGNYYYIDGISQARRVFQEQIAGTLEVVAQDVKIQVEFDPKQVSHYRLIGYENRNIADVDFRNDRVDAGEIGAGHTVTAMYEIERVTGATGSPATVHIRAKKPRGEKAREWTYDFDMGAMYSQFQQASADFQFATAVMAAAEILRGSEHAGSWRMSEVIKIAEQNAGEHADRREFITLMGKTRPATAERLRDAGNSPTRVASINR